jgi:hypothetical protein
MMTVTVVLLIICGAIYAWLGHRNHNPADIPTIKAESNYKQKPADPGGIDIPHQDVEVYDQLEGKNTPQPQVEHLLPPPEAPKDVPHSTALVPQPQTPVADVQPPAQAVTTPPTVTPHTDAILGQGASKTIATTVAPAPIPAPTPAPVVAPTSPPATAAPQTIDDVLKNTLSQPESATPPPVSIPSGTVAVQLASVSDQTAAQNMMQNLQQKYAGDLNGITLHLTRADLGSRGVFYRIQSQPLGQDAATQLCSALKQKNTGCILVRK